jgi:hypothetical protein
MSAPPRGQDDSWNGLQQDEVRARDIRVIARAPEERHRFHAVSRHVQMDLGIGGAERLPRQPNIPGTILNEENLEGRFSSVHGGHYSSARNETCPASGSSGLIATTLLAGSQTSVGR